MQINVLEYLDKTVEKFPNKIAFEDANGLVSYEDFKKIAMSIALLC